MTDVFTGSSSHSPVSRGHACIMTATTNVVHSALTTAMTVHMHEAFKLGLGLANPAPRLAMCLRTI